MSSHCSPGSSPVPFWIARLMFSAGMLTSLAVSIAALSRMLPLGSPPPFLAATVIATHGRGLPAAPLGLGARREWPARPRAQVLAEVHVGEIRGAGVPDLAGPRLLGQHLDADLQRRAADVVEAGLERHHLVAPDRRVEVHGVQ